jgi:hypothetical protein
VHFWGLPNGQPGVSNSSSDPPHEEGCAIYRLMIMKKRVFYRAKESQSAAPDQHLNNDSEDIFAGASPGA